jgi:hypothetical protein
MMTKRQARSHTCNVSHKFKCSSLGEKEKETGDNIKGEIQIFDRGTGSKPERLRSGSLQADLSLIV